MLFSYAVVSIFLFKDCHGLPWFPIPVDRLGRVAPIPRAFEKFGLYGLAVLREDYLEPFPLIMVVSTFYTHEDWMAKVDDQGAVASDAIDHPSAVIYPGSDLALSVIRGRLRQRPEAHAHVHPPDHDQIRLRLEVVMLNDVVLHQYASLVEIPRAEVFKTEKSENWTACDSR